MSEPTDLELSIFRTICWFSVFSLPLSRFDIWKWLLRPARAYDMSEVDVVLDRSDWLRSRLTTHQGFWMLKQVSVQTSTQNQHRAFLDATRKFRTLRRASRFFASLPSVQSVAVANTLAWWHTGPESDIDLYIITKPKSIWSSRFFLVLPFLISGHRPHDVHHGLSQDPFCFSFFSTTNGLQLEDLQWNEKDYYLAYWIKSLVPIFDRSDSFSQLHTLNKWSDVLLPNARQRRIHPFHRPDWHLYLPIQWSVFEPMFRWIQRYRFPEGLRALANKDSRVVISDDRLKFHENDRRQEFMQRFQDVYDRTI